jgi:hypothetical protein
VTLESVKGSADGITEVKGITRLLPDGRLHYVEAPGAEVRFK